MSEASGNSHEFFAPHSDANEVPPQFTGVERLLGREGWERVHHAKVAVIGIGGVGSWAAEMLARSGVGTLRLIDLDEVCVSNTNRQIHATLATVGRMKVAAMAERIASFAPQCQVEAVPQFFTQQTADDLLRDPPDVIVDAIDSLGNKCFLLATCRERGIPVVSCGGAGGKIDASQVTVCDLARTQRDPLLAFVRKKLRQRYGFPRDEREPFGIQCVYSPEAVTYPEGCGEHMEAGVKLDCQTGYGNAGFVTGTFGLVAAGVVVRMVAGR